MIYKGILANPITLKNYFENEKDDLNIPEYLLKLQNFQHQLDKLLNIQKLFMICLLEEN